MQDENKFERKEPRGDKAKIKKIRKVVNRRTCGLRRLAIDGCITKPSGDRTMCFDGWVTKPSANRALCLRRMENEMEASNCATNSPRRSVTKNRFEKRLRHEKRGKPRQSYRKQGMQRHDRNVITVKQKKNRE